MPSSEFNVIPIVRGDEETIAINFAAVDASKFGLAANDLKAEFRRSARSSTIFYTADSRDETILRTVNDDKSVTLNIIIPAAMTAQFSSGGAHFAVFSRASPPWVKVPGDWTWPTVSAT